MLGSETLAKLLERRLEPGFAVRELHEHAIAPDSAHVAAFRANGSWRQRGPEPRADSAPAAARDAPRRGPDLGPHGGRRRGAHGARQRVGRSAGGAERRSAAAGSRPRCRARGRLGAGRGRDPRATARALRPDSTSLFVPRTLGEAEGAVDRVLGPLLVYDREHATELAALATGVPRGESLVATLRRPPARSQADTRLPDGPRRGADRPQPSRHRATWSSCGWRWRPFS